ncbi:MAG: hypothetical protein JXR77_10855 [Lentisphaeria bacterium]|nr:hypothetical protein [Lentisphaeria bacterium]
MTVRRLSGIVVRAAAVGVLVGLVVLGGVTAGRWLTERVYDRIEPYGSTALIGGRSIPLSVRPGPACAWGSSAFTLDESDSVAMTGLAAPEGQRWLDMAGNVYSTDFIRRFRYDAGTPAGPEVRLRVAPRGVTLTGRIEARGLKPNFVYQVKVRGLFEHREAFEAIGYAGRWRFPGTETNYTDGDYRASVRKHLAEAYVFFDILVTDARGNAAKDFVLDHSLHVVWNGSRQRDDCRRSDILPIWVDASDPEVYAVPKQAPTLERLWAEREVRRYGRGNATVRLPTGVYRAELVLTEETFHDHGSDGGWWGTVMSAPVSFEIVAEEHTGAADVPGASRPGEAAGS